MGYYVMELDDAAKKICTIVLPWGFYQYNMLPIGVESRLTETIRQFFYMQSLDEKVKQYVKACKDCQEAKVTAVQPVGKLPIRIKWSGTPFEYVRIDCCGPWQINVSCKKPKKVVKREVHAVTMIDNATMWPEIIQLEGKLAYHLAKKIEPTTVLNPRSNGIKKRMHLTMANMLRTMKFTVADDKEGTWRTKVDAALQAIAWALRTIVSAGTKYSPANVTLGRDMILNQEVQVNWDGIKKYQENKAQIDNGREDAKCREHVYEEDMKCWIVKNKFERKSKLNKPAEGPFKILKVYQNQNGTVRLNRNRYEETINIRRDLPSRIVFVVLPK